MEKMWPLTHNRICTLAEKQWFSKFGALMSFKDDLLGRARDYMQRNGLILGDELGCGVHGIVFATESQPEKGPSAVRSALKIHLLRYDDSLWIVDLFHCDK
jgi:hypothetical protein